MTRLDDRPWAAESQSAQVLFEEARRLRRRRWKVGVLALAVSLTTVAVVVARAPSASRRAAHKTGALAQQARSVMPAEVVVWSNHFRIEVISSTTGHVIRTLATDVGVVRGLPSLSVSPAGTVYFNNHASFGPVDQILSVPVTGGVPSHIADGRSPAVSPDERFLAYISNDNTIVVENLRTHAIRSWTDTPESDLWSLSWSPDSRFLSFTQVAPTIAPTSSNSPRTIATAYVVLDTRTSSLALGPARRLVLAAGVSWAGFMAQKRGGQLLGVGLAPRRGGAVRLVAIDARSGRIIRSLVHIPGGLFKANSLDGPEGTIQADPSGKYLLVAASGTGSGQLYRWASGTARPIAIAKGVVRAAWVPASIG